MLGVALISLKGRGFSFARLLGPFGRGRMSHEQGVSAWRRQALGGETSTIKGRQQGAALVRVVLGVLACWSPCGSTWHAAVIIPWL